MIDPNGIFLKIKEEVLLVFPESKVYAYGSRIRGNGKKWDFDVIIRNTSFSLSPTPDYEIMLEKGKSLAEKIRTSYTDEFDRPVIVDFFFTASFEVLRGVEI